MVRLSQLLDLVSSMATIAAAGLLGWFVLSHSHVSDTMSQGPGALLNGRSDKEATGAQQEPIIEDIEAKHWVVQLSLRDVQPRRESVAIVEFSDFQCPYCGKFARETYGAIKNEFVDAGTVLYVFRNFPLEAAHPNAARAAEATECAGAQGKYWEMHDRLFLNQHALAASDLVRYAGDLQLNPERFNECFTQKAMAMRVNADLDEGARLGVQGTPTFFVGRVDSDRKIRLLKRIAGAGSVEFFRAALRNIATVALAR